MVHGAAKMKEQIHWKTKKFRYNKVMECQNKISKEIMNKKIGKDIEVLIENMILEELIKMYQILMD